MEIDEIKALLSLLDDPDPEVNSQVRNKVIEQGRTMLPFLEEFIEEGDHDEKFCIELEALVREVQVGGMTRELELWFEAGAQDLIEGALLLARYGYPELDDLEVRSFIANLRQDIWLELNESLTAFERVKVMNIVLFEQFGFRGNKEAYHSPENSFINKVIEEKKGNPLLLSILYMTLARSLDIPIRGINLPNHFLVAYINEEADVEAELQEEDILFYINPFSKGAILHKAEIDSFLKHLDLNPEPRFFIPCSNADMMRRMVNNLMHAYQKSGDDKKVEELSRFVQLVTTQK